MDLLAYLAEEFDSFENEPFNPVDSAALSQFCMIRAEGIAPALPTQPAPSSLTQAIKQRFQHAPKPARFMDFLRAERFAGMFTGLVPGDIKENLVALAASPRFRAMDIQNYESFFDPVRQTQFAAFTFTYENAFSYIGFRGTDSSFVGWRENFNMACTTPVPAQNQALAYVKAVAARTTGKLIIGGHSKGGNLALFAALKAGPEIQARIERVYSHDGPGFKAGTFVDQDWANLDGRIHRTIPQDCVVGLLMNTDVTPLVVKSNDHGIMQHSLFTWEIENSDFVYVDDVTDSAKFTDAVFSTWLAQYSDAEAARIVDALFKAVEASNAHDAMEIFFGGIKTLSLIGEAATKIDPESRAVRVSALGSLAEIAARNATRGIAGKIAPKS